MVWSKRSRRGGKLKSRIALQKPTAAAQQKQLATLARLAVKNSKILNSQRTYTDWVDSRDVSLSATDVWYNVALMQPGSWSRVARKNEDYLNQSNTVVRDLMFEYFCGQGDKVSPVTWSVFIVTIRPNATYDSGVTMVDGQEFVGMGSNCPPQLNSGIFKVHFARSHRTNLVFPSSGVAQAPGATVNGSKHFDLNIKIRSPEDSYWKQTTIADVPRHDRYYLLVNAKSADATATSAKFNFGAKFTVVNSD